ncbi:hypothetical protein ThvES_00020510, partial [Thiovulum sp. ES]
MFQSDENLGAFYKAKLEKWAGTGININTKVEIKTNRE